MFCFRGLSLRRITPESGVALVLVLWMLVLLTTIAQSLAFSSRTDVLIAGNLASQAKAEAIADAAVHRAIHLLTRNLSAPAAQIDPLQWKADGISRAWRYRDAELRVTIIGESGKIDINAAPPPLLIGLFVSVGVEREAATALVDAMLDWRDTDELRRPQGAEKAEYVAAGLSHVPGNVDFTAIDELQQVLGMNEDLFRRIESLITVHSYQPGIDLATAPRGVLMALPNVTPEQVDHYISDRLVLLQQGLLPPPFAPAQGFTAGSNNSAVSIQIEVVLSDNTQFFRQAVARLGGMPNEPASFLAWRAPQFGAGQSVPHNENIDSDGEIR